MFRFLKITGMMEPLQPCHPLTKSLKSISKISNVGINGYAWVVNEQGKEISSPFPDHIGRNVYDLYKGFPELTSLIDRMLQGKEGITAYHFYRSRKPADDLVLRHAVYMPISFGNTFWSIAISTPEDEVIASLSGFRSKLFTITIALF